MWPFRQPRRRFRDERMVATLMDMPIWAIVAILAIGWLLVVFVVAVIGVFFHTPQSWLTYVGGVLVLVFAAIGYWIALGERSLHRRRLEIASSLHRLGALSPYDFEYAVSELFRLQGYVVTPNKHPYDEDGGVDMEIAAAGKTRLVQVKTKWGDVPVDEVRELWGVAMKEQVAGAVFVATKGFSPAAIDFAKGLDLELIDGQKFLQLRTMYLPAEQSLAINRDPMVSQGFAAYVARQRVPACPDCAKPMQLVTMLHGVEIAWQVWSCWDYPTCKGRRGFPAYAPELDGSSPEPSPTVRRRWTIAKGNRLRRRPVRQNDS